MTPQQHPQAPRASHFTPPSWEERQLPPVFERRGHLHRGRRPKGGFGRALRLLVIAIVLAIPVYGLYLLDIPSRLRSMMSEEVGVAPIAVLSAPDEPWLPLTEAQATAVVMHTVRRGDTVGSIVQSIGLPPENGIKLHSAFNSVVKEEDASHPIQPGHVLRFSFAPDGRLEMLSTELSEGHELTLVPRDDGSFAAKLVRPPVRSSEQLAFGLIETSFAAAASKTGVSYEVIDDLVDLFSDRVEFHKDFRVGDRFTLIYRDQPRRRRRVKDNDDVSGSSILAAALEVGGQHLVAARYVGSDGKARYFDEKGKLLGNAFLRYPLKFSRISSYFSSARFHPVLKFSRPHNGVDFAAPVGTPVRTVADGTVEFAGRRGGSGIMVKIRHSTRYSTAYLHLSALGRGIKNGVRVRRGQVIGLVGMTGLATGPHLHFSFYDNDKYIDPLKIKLPTLDSLDGEKGMSPEYLKRVLFTLEHYQTVSLTKFYAGESN